MLSTCFFPLFLFIRGNFTLIFITFLDKNFSNMFPFNPFPLLVKCCYTLITRFSRNKKNMSEILCSCGSNLEEFSLLECDTVWFSRNKCTNVLEERSSIFKAEVTPLPGDMVSLYKRQFFKRVLSWIHTSVSILATQ